MSTPLVARLLIDGAWRTGETYNVYHPQSKEIASTAVCASSEDCVAAAEAAGRALPSWESTAPTLRRRILLKAADLLESDAYQKRIRESTCRETGALEFWGHFNATLGGQQMREAASLATNIRGEMINSEVPGAVFMVHRRAIGVVLAISPWNAPAILTVRAVAVPLICGNTVVLKSSEVSPYTNSIIVEALQEAGLPKGVLNFINTSRETAPVLTAQLIAHPLVRKINFTGGDHVGRILATEAAKYLKPCVLELGGKAACVVLNDANIGVAAKAIVSGSMMNSGQICMSTERVIVQRSVSEALVKAIYAIVSRLEVGDSATVDNNKISVGPVFSEIHAKAILNLLQEAKEEGAEVLNGDMIVDGAILKPHVLLNVRPGMRIWERETFGPVVVVAVVDTVDEAIELANATDYTLTAAVWTSSLDGVEIASRIRAGTVIVNGSTFAPDPTFGVYGLGGATGYGAFDIENFTDKRAIAVRPPNESYPFVDSLLQI